jgi:hypothetical protein
MSYVNDLDNLRNKARTHGEPYLNRFDATLHYARKRFKPFGNLSNVEILVQTLTTNSVSAKIVAWLKQNEKEDNWPLKGESVIQKEIMDTVGVDKFPHPAKNRQRWFLLLYIASSLLEGFAYGNLFSNDMDK